jgi:hypothetical protein
MSKPSALRALKQTRRLDVAAYLAAVSPDTRTSSKVRRVLKRRTMMKKELMKP